MSMVDFHAGWTVAILVVFIAIVAWAWSGKRRKDFDEAARIPLDDDQPVPGQRAGEDRARGDTEENRNG